MDDTSRSRDGGVCGPIAGWQRLERMQRFMDHSQGEDDRPLRTWRTSAAQPGHFGRITLNEEDIGAMIGPLL
eukprot:4675772-Amphidinium_carterae.3